MITSAMQTRPVSSRNGITYRSGMARSVAAADGWVLDYPYPARNVKGVLCGRPETGTDLPGVTGQLLVPSSGWHTSWHTSCCRKSQWVTSAT